MSSLKKAFLKPNQIKMVLVNEKIWNPDSAKRGFKKVKML